MSARYGDDGTFAPVGWRRPHASMLPVSGAWRPSDPTGDRQFMRTAMDRDFVLEGGGRLRDITVAFETWGTLDEDADERGPGLPRPHRRQPRRGAGRAGSSRRAAGGTR